MPLLKKAVFLALLLVAAHVIAGDANGLKGNAFERSVDGADWIMSFGDDGTLKVYRDGEAEADVAYTVADDVVTLTDREGSCHGDQATGTYRWQRGGNALTMELIEDPCEPRRGVVAADDWQVHPAK